MKEFFDGIGNLIVRMNDVEFTSICKIVFFLSATALVALACAGGSEKGMLAAGLLTAGSAIVAGIANSN